MLRRVAMISLLLGCSSAPAAQTDAGVDAANDVSAPVDAGDDASLPGWKLVWSDEFDGADGSAPDPTIWSHEVGGDGWGNDELEYYTDGAENSVVQNGNLVITATTAGASKYSCANDGAGGACKYTSARITTEPKANVTGFAGSYGRFAARMKVPAGKGLWPAFWLLGTNITQVGWPTCGEVDIMEILGNDTTTMYGSLHSDKGAGEWSTGSPFVSSAGSFSDDFHVFAIEWKQGQVDFFVDQTKYETVTSAEVDGGGTWEFDGHPFYILLNLAVGSKDSWPGAPDQTTAFPAQLLVDWVRVYAPD
jgi:beta-glucanase (GH16 family)